MNETEAQLAGILSAQRFLLEQVFANAYANDPDAFAAFMEEAIRKPFTPPGPMDANLATIQADASKDHLQRFMASTLKRMRRP